MRYIDDMIKGIPLEEMTGGTDMNNTNEIKGLIPDEPISESIIESYEQNSEAAETASEAEREKKPISTSKPARIKKRWTGAVAAVLALTVTAGGVLAYLGAAKNIGPLASVLNSDSRQADAVDGTDAARANANANAKLVFTTVNAYVADLVCSGRLNEVPKGTFTYDLSDLSDAEPGWKKLFTDMVNSSGADFKGGGEAVFYINSVYKIDWAQWKAPGSDFVGQYPNPGEDVTLGEYKYETADDAHPGTVAVQRYEYAFELIGELYRNISYGPRYIPENDIKAAVEAIKTDKEVIAVDTDAPQIYGPAFKLAFEYGGESYEISTSERPETPIVINGEYCRCAGAEKLLEKYGVIDDAGYAHSYWAWISADLENGNSFSGYPLGSHEAEILKWYEDFLAAGYKPAANVGTERSVTETKYVMLNFNGRMIPIVNTKFSGANVQVGNQYYNVPDTSVFDSLEAAYNEALADHEAFAKEALGDAD